MTAKVAPDSTTKFRFLKADFLDESGRTLRNFLNGRLGLLFAGDKILHFLKVSSSCRFVLVGQIIGGRFEVGKLAGQGSMGAVFRAHDRATDKPVAIKVLSQHDADAVRRFDHEARMLSELAHPHIVQHVAHGATSEGIPYLVMEWLEGQSLAARLQQSRLSQTDALELATHIASALAAAHTRGIVHRDIKPSNIFLVNGSVLASRVLDFGIAQATYSGVRVTRTGGTVGTPGYMAPEQVQGSRERATARVDIFSLGALLFECLTGRRAFEGDDMMAILARVLREDAPRVRSFLPDVPEELDTLVAHMLSRVPEVRPANGAQVHRALQQVTRRISMAVHDEPRGSRLRPELENRLLCVVVAAAIEEVGGRDSSPTLRTTLSPSNWHSIEEVAMDHGGIASEFPGGGVLVRVHGTEGLITRAARCALAISRIVEGFRVALVTGCADESRELPYADLIGRAIQALAYSDRIIGTHGVRVDDVTAALLDGQFEVTGTKEAPRLCHEKSDFGPTKKLFDKPTPFVGRKRELDTFVDFLAEALPVGGAATGLIVAPAGMGKSRLGAEIVTELQRRIPDVVVSVARAASISIPHGLITNLVRHVLQLPCGTSKNRIREALDRVMPGADQSKRRILVQFFETNAGESSVPSGSEEDEQEAWLDLLGILARQRPLLLVVEDAQWADDTSMEFLQDALAQVDMHSFGVLALARPEIREKGFGLFHRRDVQEMRLGPLSPKAAAKYVTTFLPGPQEIIEAMIARSEGLPLFLEELVRAAIHDREIRFPPEMLLAVHGPQIAQLPADAQYALRIASFVGVTFWLGAVTTLGADTNTDAEFRYQFDQLVANGFIARRRTSRVPHDIEYVFAQPSMREALLISWTEDDRRLGQRLAQDWLDKRGVK